MVPYAILGLRPATAALVERQIGELGHLVKTWRHADGPSVEEAARSEARLYLVGAEGPEDGVVGLYPADAPPTAPPQVEEDALEAARTLAERGQTVALVHPDPDQATLLRAMRLGCRDVIAAQDGEALAALVETAAGDRGAMVGGTGGLVAVMGSHGGVGTTTVALALADLLARDPAHTVVVADLDEADRTLRSALDLPAGLTARGLVHVAATMDPQKVRGALGRAPEGFWVLGQDEDALSAPPLSAEEVPVVVSLLRRAFGTVVVDLGSTFNDVAWELVDDAHLGVLVTTQDLMALRTARTRLDQLERLGLHADLVALVVNRYDRGTPPPVAAIEEQLRVPVAATIPDSPRKAKAAMGKGVPLSEVAENGRVARGLDDLVERLTGAPPAGRRRHWWQRRHPG